MTASLVNKLAVIAADIKLSHSIFALPFALLATFMAAGGWPRLGILFLIVICMVLARTTAMGANRLIDARLDAQNPRTAGRALPAGRVSIAFYISVIALCVAGFVLAAAGFWWLYGNRWPLVLSIPVLAFLAGYPLMKRFTRLCHYYLGAALGLAPLCAWVAVAGRAAWEPAIMGSAVLFWTAGFDILYASQDYENDLKTGTFSVPAKIGIPRALFAAVALGMARALGETLAVLMLAGNTVAFPHSLLQRGQPLTALLATELGETAVYSMKYQALFASGFFLMVIVLGINILIWIMKRKALEHAYA